MFSTTFLVFCLQSLLIQAVLCQNAVSSYGPNYLGGLIPGSTGLGPNPGQNGLIGPMRIIAGSAGNLGSMPAGVGPFNLGPGPYGAGSVGPMAGPIGSTVAPYGSMAEPFGQIGGPIGRMAGVTGPMAGPVGAYGYGCASPYGGSGVGDVAVMGELPVAGTTNLAGHVPITGAVQFSGPMTAVGAVTISGTCGGNMHYRY